MDEQVKTEELQQLQQQLQESQTPHRLLLTSWGLPILCYWGADERMHLLTDPKELLSLNGVAAPWEYGQSWQLSRSRMSEICQAADQAELSIRQQLQQQREQQKLQQPRESDQYVPAEEHDRQFRDMDWTVDGFELSEEQISAVKLILTSNKVVSVLTGLAGSGKSAIVRWLQQNCMATVCATTGRAAVNVGGVTVDSLFGLNRDKWEISWGPAEKALQGCHRLIVVDEASMVGKNMGDLLITAAEKLRKRLLLVGDFAQATPVKDDWIMSSRILSDSLFIRLTECHRQGDQLFLQVLNKLRVGLVDQQVDELMTSRISACPSEDGWVRMFATNRLTELYNQQQLEQHVQRTSHLAYPLHATFVDDRSEKARESWPRKNQFIQQVLDSMPFINGQRLALGAQVLFVVNEPATPRKFVNGDVGQLEDVGVYVETERLRRIVEQPDRPMFYEGRLLVSQDDLAETDGPEVQDLPGKDLRGKKLVWLSQLTPEDQRQLLDRLSDGHVRYLKVRLDRTDQPVVVGRIPKAVKDAKDRLNYTVWGFPLRAGWAVTIHKSQGMTVDRAYLDMDSIRQMPETGRHGLAYVGLSRVRTLEGLRISSWAPDVVYSSPEVRHLI